MVEHLLAKQDVAGSNPVSRSSIMRTKPLTFPTCPVVSASLEAVRVKFGGQSSHVKYITEEDREIAARFDVKSELEKALKERGLDGKAAVC